MIRACLIDNEVPVVGRSIPKLNNCGVTLASTATTLSVTDANPPEGRLYQFYVNEGADDSFSPDGIVQAEFKGIAYR